MSEPARQRILIIGPSNIGDAILAGDVIAAVRRRFPDAHLTLLVGERAKSLFLGDPRIQTLMDTSRYESALGRLQLTAVLWQYHPHVVVDQARALVAMGHPEIVLTGVDLGHYGADLLPRTSLAALVRALVELPGLRWLRLSSVLPAYFTPELIDVVTSSPLGGIGRRILTLCPPCTTIEKSQPLFARHSMAAGITGQTAKVGNTRGPLPS